MTLLRLLLLLYPAAFRADYECELLRTIEARLRTATATQRLLLWVDVVMDTVLSAARVHFDLLVQDMGYAGRSFRRSPGFALLVIAITALGVGATTAAFSLTDHVLLRPFPFTDSDRLVRLWEDQRPSNYSAIEPSPANYRDWKRMALTSSNGSFEKMAAYRNLSVNMLYGTTPERIDGACVSAELLPMLGVHPVIGRVFAPADDQPGAPGTALIGYDLWQYTFGSDPAILGRNLLLDHKPYTVIGVLPSRFAFPRRAAQVWTTLRFTSDDYKDRTNNYLSVLAKLRRGAGLDSARAEMRMIADQVRRDFPKDNEHVSVSISTLRDDISDGARLLLLAVLAASLGLLLIACVNLASLLLTRAMLRQKELSVRTALGAGRERLIRQLLTENLLMAFAGGTLGIYFALVALPLWSKLVPEGLPLAATPAIDARVLVVALAVVLITGLGFSVAPALRATSERMQEGARGDIGGRRERFRGSLVSIQVCASVVLVIVTGLLIRALFRVQSVHPGFEADGLLTMRTVLPEPRYDSTARRTAFYTHVLESLRQTPGVRKTAYISFLPIVMRGGIWPVTVEGHPTEKSGFHQASVRFVTPGFFETMAIPLLQGRDVTDADSMRTPMAAVVSRSFVNRYFSNKDPIGRRIQVGEDVARTVVGVVADIRVRGLERSSEPQVYIPHQQVPDGSFQWFAPKDLVIQSGLSPSTLVSVVRRAVSESDAEIPVSDVQTMLDVVHSDVMPRLAQIRVLLAFGIAALLLAAIGIYGLLSFAVASRTREIGVRIALGARGSAVLGMIVRQGLVLAATGILVAVPIAYAGGRSLLSILAGVTALDPMTYSVAITLALLMAFAGSLLPAIRAVRVDPIAAIRGD